MVWSFPGRADRKPELRRPPLAPAGKPRAAHEDQHGPESSRPRWCRSVQGYLPAGHDPGPA